MTAHHIPLAAGLSLVVRRSVAMDEAWLVLLEPRREWERALSQHPTRQAAVLAATDVASCCAAALAAAAGCGRAAL